MDLASTLQQLGSRVLVVDANPMDLHSSLLREGAGLTELLAGEVGAQELVREQVCQGETLNVVTTGRASARGVQRLDLLRSAIEHWQNTYDMVLLDVPPVLLSADAELLIDAIGQVFLVVEVGNVTRGDVSQARTQLQRIDPGAVGLIVNKMPMQSTDSTLKEQVVESITRERFARVMSMSHLSLQVELLRLRLSQWWHRR